MEMNLNTRGINTNTVAITDYKIVANRVARIVIAFTGHHTKESLTEAIASQLQNLAVPVEHSFRMIKDNVAVGFVRANREIRAVADPKELRAAYKVVSSNIMMDNKDKSLWEVKEGAGGKFLARHGNEDLSELVGATVNRRPDVPRLAQLATATASKREFVAFASASGDMDYGFCLGANKERGIVKILSATTSNEVIIPVDTIASVIPVGGAKIPMSAHKRITEAGISREDATQEKEYYTRLYSYAPDYLAEVIRNIDSTASM